MAAYADLAAVKARAGVLANSWSAATTPSNTDISGFLDDVAAEIDALLTARGYTPPVAGSAAAKALKGINADGALVLALEATFPEGSGPSSAGKPLDEARARYENAYDALLDGSLPALALLASSGAAPSASNFFSNEPEYGTVTPTRLEDTNAWISPGVGRNQPF